MAKYVCDYETVKEIGKAVCDVAQSVVSDLDTYSGNVESDLNGWNSAAKNSFVVTNAAQVATGKTAAEYATSVGNYIQTAAQKIQETDSELAGQITI
ncbi:MAG: hypothetical protein IJI58_03850 [Bacilli bacterium]|nr:hypothetical protein [Bacilli bacterium]